MTLKDLVSKILLERIDLRETDHGTRVGGSRVPRGLKDEWVTGHKRDCGHNLLLLLLLPLFVLPLVVLGLVMEGHGRVWNPHYCSPYPYYSNYTCG